MMADPLPRLAVRHLSKSFGSIKVLNGVSLDAEKGQVVSIIGASGSGKSTFLRCLNLLEVPDAGEIRLDGRPVHVETRRGRLRVSKETQTLRASLPMVFQSFNLWRHMTVLDNVAAAPIHVLKRPRSQAYEHAAALLARVGLANHAGYYPHQLSGGQQQRAAIARALAMEPKVLLFDEPTSALDPELVGEVLKVIETLADAGNTMILVTHEMGFARNVSDQVVLLDHGKIVESGPPQQIFEAPKSQRAAQFIASVMLKGRHQ